MFDELFRLDEQSNIFGAVKILHEWNSLKMQVSKNSCLTLKYLLCNKSGLIENLEIMMYIIALANLAFAVKSNMNLW